MTDSYHYQIEPEPRTEVPKFRIGAVYRQKNGALVRLSGTYMHSGAPVEAGHAQAQFVERDSHDGWRSLATGYYSNRDSNISLIPGELVERDGEWVAADAPIVFPSGAAVLTSGDKIVGRVEAEALADGLSPIAAEAAASLGTVAIDEDDIAWAAASAKPEPIRAPLPHFNQRTEFDAFPDFVVFHEFEPTSPLYDSPTTDSAYPAIAGLLRG